MDIQEIKESRGKGIVAFTKFCQDKKGHEDCLFCFFEGEDAKYYGARIEQYTEYPTEKIINYNCGGRKEVERAYFLISQKHEYDEINKMFFIDSDYISNNDVNPDIYQTPCYSIENFYSSTECFGKIINREFGINCIDEDYKKCVCDYKKRQEEFHLDTEFLNVWLFGQRIEEETQKEKAVILNDFKVARFFSEISISKIEQNETFNETLLKSIFPKAYNLNEEVTNRIREKWVSASPQKVYRGKFEMEFLRKILESLISKNKTHTYFSVIYNCVHLTPGSNMLSNLSVYADTPTCLVTFLQSHKLNRR